MWIQGMLIAIAGLLLQCKPGSFTGKSESKSAATSATPTPTEPDSDDDDSIVAQEPVAIGGAYLACFFDPQLDKALLPELLGNRTVVGCQSFADNDYQLPKKASALTILSASSEKLPKQKLAVLPLLGHPRWSWVILLPTEAQGGRFYLRLREGEQEVIKMRAELLDILPSGLIAAAALKGSFHLRVRGTQTCITGDPVWSWDTATNTPITPQMTTSSCDTAVKFGFDAFETGFRMFTANPKPYACDTQNYAVEHCQDSCADLEDYGRGTRVNLFACTKSVEAQRHNFAPAAGGSFRLRTNGRFLFLQDGRTVATADSTLLLELVPLP